MNTRSPEHRLLMVGVPVLIIGVLGVSAAFREIRKINSWGRVESKRRAYLRELARELGP